MSQEVRSYIHPLQAAFKDNLWGGNRLREEYGKESDLKIIAEAWELSCHPAGPSIVKDLNLSLPEYLEKYPERFGTAYDHDREFPILIKLIDANKDLSVQVHPDDSYAMEHENQYGKTEMWYVVDTKPGAFIYYGFQKEISKEEFTKSIEENTIEDFLEKVEVQKGDCFFIPAGTIHAIGSGCLIAEVQQSSNVTYRVYDYDRRDDEGNPRELHIEKSKEVTSLRPVEKREEDPAHMVSCEYFKVDLLEVEESAEIEVGEESFAHIMLLDGTVEVLDRNENVNKMQKGDSALVDSGAGTIRFEGQGKVLISRI